jgi:hypothetical protein
MLAALVPAPPGDVADLPARALALDLAVRFETMCTLRA